uniref:Uncharacterized protein n=1 Tax=Chenopodium quinoa TaxID=63459 RepID=A0A803N670_CHEQI
MRNRRGLPLNHKWRKLQEAFDKTVEKGTVRVPLSGDDVLMQCSQFTQVPFGKVGTKRKWEETNSLYGWRKQSIFFQLPYWRKLKLRHNLNVMHIEKNISENILGTLMNIKDKTKDTIKARLDLVKMDIRQDLHPIVDEDKTEKNDGVLHTADVVWLAQHTTINEGGILQWVDDNRSKEVHAQLHQLVQDKDKEPEGDQPRPQTQEEMLIHVLGPKSGYTRGKGNGYGGSAKARLQEEQQQIMRKQQEQITHLQIKIQQQRQQKKPVVRKVWMPKAQ